MSTDFDSRPQWRLVARNSRAHLPLGGPSDAEAVLVAYPAPSFPSGLCGFRRVDLTSVQSRSGAVVGKDHSLQVGPVD